MEALGIETKLFLGQIVNFLILFGILSVLVYKPILKLLNERRDKISESLKNAKEIEEKLARTTEETNALIKKAQKESEKIIDNSRKLAAEQKTEMIAAAKSQAEKEIAKAKEAIQKERDDAAKSLQKEIAALVSLATVKILKKNASPESQRAAIEEAIEEMRNEN